MPDPIIAQFRRRWRNPVFLLVFVPCSLVWLAFVGWVAWVAFNPVMGWIGQQNEIVQEVLWTAAVLAWALLFGLGVGGFAHLAEGVAGLRPPVEAFPPAGPAPGGGRKWERGRNWTDNSAPTDGD